MSAEAVIAQMPNVVHASERLSPSFRHAHLVASQWPAAVGYDPNEDPAVLFGRLTGVTPWAADAESEASEIAVALADGLSRLAAKRLGLSVAPTLTLRHPRHPWAVAAPAGLCEDGSIIHVTPTGFATNDDAEDEEWGDADNDVPARVLTHAMGELTVTRAWKMVHMPMAPETREAHVAVLLGGRARGFRLYRVEWDEDFARRLFDRVARFWLNVQAGLLPEPGDTEAFYKYLTARYPKHAAKKWVDADEAITRNVEGWAQLDAQIAALKARRHAAKNAVCMRVGDAEGVRGGEGAAAWRLPWRYCKGKKALDEADLRQRLIALLGLAKADELIAACTKEGNGYRKLGPMWRGNSPKKIRSDVQETAK